MSETTDDPAIKPDSKEVFKHGYALAKAMSAVCHEKPSTHVLVAASLLVSKAITQECGGDFIQAMERFKTWARMTSAFIVDDSLEELETRRGGTAQ